jgi:hypothetical protein
MSAAAAPASEASTQVAVSPPIGLTPIAIATPGPVLNIVVVPNCYGMSQVGCEAALTAQGLRLGTVTFLAPAGPPPYIGSHVVSQTPAAGRFAWRGSAVNISIQPFGPPYRP